jgi:hypothetical protein
MLPGAKSPLPVSILFCYQLIRIPIRNDAVLIESDSKSYMDQLSLLRVVAL